jgi:chemotaxis protein CheY-P-specific phosphatase CheC
MVLNILAGFAEQSISYVVNNKHMDSGVCYQVKLINSQQYGSIGFIFSNELAYGLVKEMTTMDAVECINVMYSALQEVSEIIGARIAGLLSRETGSDISIEMPITVPVNTIHGTTDIIMINTQLGSMEMFLI